ncbi:hypothetical protein NEHOM01_1246 [Nematocida homosporus]|uniref:uncharacterized protein n=1 Tax=Nematocida homosporus TaxID=1912981 RepID=UPI00221F2409|nr:uncharacterized protein NEHOM01_1246 [Nematocida homosporus]KAI5186043.1 hypothetical protein NEHOM01_1246 [Nematocida homosporus]
MSNQRMIDSYSFKSWYFGATGCWLIKLCALLVCLNVIVGAGDIDGIDSTPVHTQVDIPGQEEIVKALISIGFCLNESATDLHCLPYTTTPVNELSSESNPIPNSSDHLPKNAPLYVIERMISRLDFTLPYYQDLVKVTDDLEMLRKIGVLRVDTARVNYASSNPLFHQENLMVLSRVVNLFDCRSLEICFGDNQDMDVNASQMYFDVCQREALEVTKWAEYKTDCTLVFLSKTNSSISKLIDSGIVLLRPMSGVRLVEEEAKDTCLIGRLPLKDGYRIHLHDLPDPIALDFGFLQNPSPRCSMIAINENKNKKATVTGLEHAIDNHPDITLYVSWQFIRNLDENTDLQIRVHTIKGLDVELFSINPLFAPSPSQAPYKPRIFATKLVSSIAPLMPCDPNDPYIRACSLDAYPKYGIVPSDVTFEYEMPRLDLSTTLNMLHSIDALPETLADTELNNVYCTGHDLSLPGWTLQETVDIRLDVDNLGNLLQQYQRSYINHFCQNMKYRDIKIAGGQTPTQKQVDDCLRLLALFRNLKTQKLEILNVRNANQDATMFDLPAIKERIDRLDKYRLEIKTLILNNVDGAIINWIMARCMFADLVEIQILNQHYPTLAIVQILALPIAEKIKTLTLNNIHDLTEVKQYPQRVLSKEFSMFSYVNNATAAGKTTQDLGLEKVFLQVRDVVGSTCGGILPEYAGYGINVPTMLFDDYLLMLSTKSVVNRTNKLEFLLYGATLNALVSDFTNCQSRQLPNQKSSITELSVCFTDNLPLAEPTLITIIRWVACRFKDVTTLRLVNVTTSTNDLNVMRARNYLICGLDALSSIFLENSDLNSPVDSSVELLIRPHRIGLLANVSQPEPEAIQMSYPMLPQLLAHIDHLNVLTPSTTGPNKVLSAVLKRYQDNLNSSEPFECSICCRTPLVLNRSEQTSNQVQTESVPTLQSDSLTHLTIMCYFKCGHGVCSNCVIGIHSRPNNPCPICRNPNVCENIHRLVSAPLSCFVFADDSLNTPAPHPDWPNNLACSDEQVYLYLSYRDGTGLAVIFDGEVAYSAPGEIHVI